MIIKVKQEWGEDVIEVKLNHEHDIYEDFTEESPNALMICRICRTSWRPHELDLDDGRFDYND